MNKVFFDLEWNTGFLDGNSFDEVIEIGAVKTNEEFQQIDGFRQLIRPVIYRKMNPYIQKMLAITMKDLQDADPLRTVIEEFFGWCEDCDTLIAWSSNDFGVLEKNLSHIGMKVPEHLKRYDVQMAYSYRTEKSIRNYALKTAVEAMELPEPEEQSYHDAYYDAQFTAAIGRALIERYGPLPSEEELQTLKNTLVKPKKPKIPLMYSVKKAIRLEKYTAFPCPTCGLQLRLPCWYALDDKHFIGRARCPECGFRYAELSCDNFRRDRCDAHFTLWGESSEHAKAMMETAQEADHCIKLYPPHRIKDNKP